jgi:DNA/RNA-binding domain of Phe-tRNA-synthetase-like protein
MTNDQNAVQVSPEVFNQLPSLVLISGVADLASTPDTSAIKTYLDQSWEKLKQKLVDDNSEESVRIQRWNDYLKNAGIHVKDYPPSIKAIAKRAAKGGEPFSINPIVDTYNAICMDLALPLGAYDLSQLDGSLQLRLSQGAENFVALGSDKNDPTLAGEIVYSDQSDILTRMFLWRQSIKAKIGGDTKHFVFVCELLDTMEEGLEARAKKTILSQMEDLLGARISTVSVQKHL